LTWWNSFKPNEKSQLTKKENLVMSNLAIVRISVDRDVFLLISEDQYLPAKYVSKFSDETLTDKEVEYLYNSLRDQSIKWSHLFCSTEALNNSALVLA
jgi:hypothetical protein